MKKNMLSFCLAVLTCTTCLAQNIQGFFSPRGGCAEEIVKVGMDCFSNRGWHAAL